MLWPRWISQAIVVIRIWSAFDQFDRYDWFDWFDRLVDWWFGCKLGWIWLVGLSISMCETILEEWPFPALVMMS